MWTYQELKVIRYQLELGNNLPTFCLNAPVVIWVKVIKCELMLLFTHALLRYTSLEVWILRKSSTEELLHHLNRVRLIINFHFGAGRRRDTTWLLAHCDEEAGREVQSSPTFESVSSSSATRSRERMVLSPSVLSFLSLSWTMEIASPTSSTHYSWGERMAAWTSLSTCTQTVISVLSPIIRSRHHYIFVDGYSLSGVTL